MPKKKIESKALGLEIGLVLSKYFLKTEDLHFGMWNEGEKVDISTLRQAQENHSNFIISNIPEGVNNVLDVGCGGGNFSRKLIAKGLNVDGVIPSQYLAEQTRLALGDGSQVFQCKYEDMTTDKRYDLIIFSESFQYVDIEKALDNSAKFLKDSGSLLICDFFQTTKHRGPIKGGHKFWEFEEAIKKSSFKEITNIDITPNTALTLDLVDQGVREVATPVRDILGEVLQTRYPIISRILKWKFRKKIDKVTRKYFSGVLNAKAFSDHKTYRLMLYAK